MRMPIPALCMAGLLCLSAPRPASAAPWLQVESPHFSFIFQEQDRPSVNVLLGVCEEAYQKVTGFFKSYPKKVPVIVFGRTEIANGWTTVMPPRILVNTAAPTGTLFGARNTGWLQLVLTHELVHYVHMTMDRGLFGALSRVFGPDTAAVPFAFLPGWMVEGPSTELETLFTEGGRGRSAWWEWYTKAPVMEDRLWSLDRASFPSAYPPYGSRIYVSGRDMVDHILRHYGEDAFTRIMDDYLTFPFLGPWGAIKRVTGTTGAKIWADMAAELAAKFFADTALPAGRLLTPDRIADYHHPQATARGLYLVRSDLERFPSIISYDPASKKEIVILEAGLADAYSFAADASGKTIWLTPVRMEGAEPPEQEASTDLYSCDVDSRRMKRLTYGARLIQPAVSADGGRLIAVQHCGSTSRLVAVDRTDGTCRVIFSRAGALITAPAVSPDGKLAAFTMNVNGFQDVYVLDLERATGSAVLQPDPAAPVIDVNPDMVRAVLGPDPYGEYLPAFAPDGSLLFSSDRTGSLCLYRAELSTGRVILIQRDPVGAGSGIIIADALIYGSYSSKGACLKETPLSSVAEEPLEPEAPQAYPEALPEAETRDAKPYHDVPRPLFWLPLPVISVTGPAGQEVGLALEAVGGSILGKWSWTASAGWFFAAMQPQASLSLGGFINGLGILDLSLGLDYGYVGEAVTGVYTQTLTASAGLTIPLLSLSFLNVSYSADLRAGLTYTAALSGPEPFTIAGSLSGGSLTGTSSALIDAGFSYSAAAAAAGGSMDMFAPLSIRASLSTTFVPPLLSAPAWANLSGLVVEADLPSPLRHQVLKLGLKTSWGMGGSAQRADALAVPRGGFTDPFPYGAAGRLLASVDYLIPIALLDAPLPLGFNLRELAAGIHAEGAAQWDTASFILSPSLWVGAEVMVAAGFNTFSQPVCVGVAARINTADPASFNAATDLKVYVTTSFDSFRSAAKGRAAAGRIAQ